MSVGFKLLWFEREREREREREDGFWEDGRDQIDRFMRYIFTYINAVHFLFKYPPQLRRLHRTTIEKNCCHQLPPSV